MDEVDRAKRAYAFALIDDLRAHGVISFEGFGIKVTIGPLPVVTKAPEKVALTAADEFAPTSMAELRSSVLPRKAE